MSNSISAHLHHRLRHLPNSACSAHCLYILGLGGHQLTALCGATLPIHTCSPHVQSSAAAQGWAGIESLLQQLPGAQFELVQGTDDQVGGLLPCASQVIMSSFDLTNLPCWRLRLALRNSGELPLHRHCTATAGAAHGAAAGRQQGGGRVGGGVGGGPAAQGAGCLHWRRDICRGGRWLYFSCAI